MFETPGWNLERGPISNKKEGGKCIYLGIGALNSRGPCFSPVSQPPESATVIANSVSFPLWFICQLLRPSVPSLRWGRSTNPDEEMICVVCVLQMGHSGVGCDLASTLYGMI